MPYEKSKELAVLLAATTSVDLQGCRHIFDASSIEELKELRTECVNADDEEYEEEEYYEEDDN